MAATREASSGRFPMPTILVTAFRADRERLRAMLVLGALYAVGFFVVMGVSALFDGGQFARLYLLGEPTSTDVTGRRGARHAARAQARRSLEAHRACDEARPPAGARLQGDRARRQEAGQG